MHEEPGAVVLRVDLGGHGHVEAAPALALQPHHRRRQRGCRLGWFLPLAARVRVRCGLVSFFWQVLLPGLAIASWLVRPGWRPGRTGRLPTLAGRRALALAVAESGSGVSAPTRSGPWAEPSLGPAGGADSDTVVHAAASRTPINPTRRIKSIRNIAIVGRPRWSTVAARIRSDGSRGQFTCGTGFGLPLPKRLQLALLRNLHDPDAATFHYWWGCGRRRPSDQRRVGCRDRLGASWQNGSGGSDYRGGG